MSSILFSKTPCTDLYRMIEEFAKFDRTDNEHFQAFVALAREIMKAAPSLSMQIADVSSLVLLARYETALARIMHAGLADVAQAVEIA